MNMFFKKSKTKIEEARNFLSSQHSSLGQICTYSESLSFHEARKVIGDAFGGSPASKGSDLINSVLAQTMPTIINDDEASTANRQALNAFSLGFFAHELLVKGGTIFGIRDRSSGALKAVVVFREYNQSTEKKPNKIVALYHNFRAYISMSKDPLGLPEILKEKGEMKRYQNAMKRMESLNGVMCGWHKEFGPQGEHFYVGVVASDPDGQGKGYCKEVMQLLGAAADDCHMACYLETQEKNQQYYEKFGYESVAQNDLVIEGREGGEDIRLPGHVMTRYSH